MGQCGKEHQQIIWKDLAKEKKDTKLVWYKMPTRHTEACITSLQMNNSLADAGGSMKPAL